MKDIVFNTWNGAFFQPGGGETQLLCSKAALEKKGYQIELFNVWKPQLNIDILHQFSIEAGGDFVVSSYKKLGKKIALSTIFWGDILKTNPHYPRIKFLVDAADILFTNSDAESDQMSRVFEVDRSKFHKTRNSITEDYLTLGDPTLFTKKYNVQGDFILSVANIDRRKNTKMLVDVCKKLKLQIVSIGHIKDEEYYAEFKNSYDGFRHLGPISDTALLKSAYMSCKAFAMPSICETPGIAALEAASQGAPVVITSEGSTKEYFGKYASYVNPLEAGSLESALTNVNKGDSESLRSYVCETYTWDKTADDIIAGYKKLNNFSL